MASNFLPNSSPFLDFFLPVYHLRLWRVHGQEETSWGPSLIVQRLEYKPVAYGQKMPLLVPLMPLASSSPCHILPFLISFYFGASLAMLQGLGNGMSTGELPTPSALSSPTPHMLSSSLYNLKKAAFNFKSSL